MKKIMITALAILFITGCSTNTEQVNKNLISYNLDNIPHTVEVTESQFDITAELLQNLGMECGTEKEITYYEELVAQFANSTQTNYKFTYTEESQIPEYTITVLPNKAGYTSLDMFKEDFHMCFAGGDMYPSMISESNLLFKGSCGTGVSDDSGNPIGCSEIAEALNKSLELN